MATTVPASKDTNRRVTVMILSKEEFYYDGRWLIAGEINLVEYGIASESERCTGALAPNRVSSSEFQIIKEETQILE
ncbi:hypothetical protein NDU88_004827 [Pleurodeles waltl]|uniref:Uncharacterized protein n=1 Tax=Pleurodeles waltl TaxID=8319 RepID=A0AAV7QFY9_PLEWA|nr:hypothetical protein NDU88_004827 [Pleurodeles waltl]